MSFCNTIEKQKEWEMKAAIVRLTKQRDLARRFAKAWKALARRYKGWADLVHESMKDRAHLRIDLSNLETEHRALQAENAALKAEVDRLKRGGCKHNDIHLVEGGLRCQTCHKWV